MVIHTPIKSTWFIKKQLQLQPIKRLKTTKQLHHKTHRNTTNKNPIINNHLLQMEKIKTLGVLQTKTR